MPKSVAFMGSKKIGHECLEHLISRRDELDIEIPAVFVNPNREPEMFYNTCSREGIPVKKNLDDLGKIDRPDFIFSVQYHLILKEPHIDHAKELAVNLHMAPLPEYRGCNQFSYAIIDDAKIFGTTLHRIDSGIDNGDIIAEKRFEIPKGFFVGDLYDVTYKKSLDLFKEQLPNIISGDITFTSQDSLIKERGTSLHYSKDIGGLKAIDLDWPAEKIERHVRATLMPGFEPPYTKINGTKIYFSNEGHLAKK